MNKTENLGGDSELGLTKQRDEAQKRVPSLGKGLEKASWRR